MTGMYITAPQAAKYLGIHIVTLYKWIKEGEIAYTKPKGRYRFKVSYLEDFISGKIR